MWIDWLRPETVLPVLDFCKNQHLVNIMGSSWSSRAKYLFLCNSTVVFPDSPFLEFWYGILKDGHNVVRTAAITPENRGEPLFEAARGLIADDAKAKRCAPRPAFEVLGIQEHRPRQKPASLHVHLHAHAWARRCTCTGTDVRTRSCTCTCLHLCTAHACTQIRTGARNCNHMHDLCGAG